MTYSIRMLAVLGLLSWASEISAADNPPPPKPAAATTAPAPKPAAPLGAGRAPAITPRTMAVPGAANSRSARAFLGVSVAPVHPAVAANLPGLPNLEQGLVVDWVADGSPAAKAGIKVPDILLAFDEQRIFSGEQFAKLIRTQKPGHDATLLILRDGKPQTLHASLGEAPASPSPPFGGPMSGFGGPMTSMRPPFRPEPALGSAWETFSSLCVKRLADNKFRAEVEYIAQEKKPRKFTFEGTPEEIRKAVESQRELSAREHYHLLHALNLHRMVDDYQPPSL